MGRVALEAIVARSLLNRCIGDLTSPDTWGLLVGRLLVGGMLRTKASEVVTGKRRGLTDAWENMYKQAEKKASGQVLQDPQETLRKMYDKLVTPKLARRGALVPFPGDTGKVEEGHKKSKKQKAKDKER